MPIQQLPRRTIKVRPELNRDFEEVAEELSAAFRACRKGEQPWPLLIYGGVGAGKTRFALLIHDWYGGRFCDFSELAEEFILVRRGELKDTRWWTQPKVSEREWRKGIRDERLLIVDEIGQRGDSDATREMLMLVLNERECKLSVFISNLAPEELVGVYDERVASRLCAGTVIGVQKHDRRTDRGA